MAFPSVQATATSFEGTDSTSHTVSLPSGIVAGDLLVVAFNIRFDRSITFPAGWTELLYQIGDGPSQSYAVHYREADGTEGATITVSTGGNPEQSAHESYRITDWEGAPEVGPVSTGTGTSPDPPSLSPSGGSQDYLWLALMSTVQITSSSVTGFPANYSNNIVVDSGGGSTGVLVASAQRALTAGVEDPGPFTLDSSHQAVAVTLAVPPVQVSEPKLVGRSVHYDFANRQVVVESGV